MPFVTQWRWHTLDNTCRVVGSILQTLRAAFPALKFVHKLRDNKLVDAVRSALSTEAWSLHFDFISWFVRWLVRLMRWVGTCSCHFGGELKNCPMVGRVLRDAYSVSESAFSEALCEAEGWASARFRGDEALLAQAQGVVRLVVGIGREKLEYLRTVPYLFVRLHEPGVVAEVIRQ